MANELPPLMFIIGTKDDVVSNDSVKEIYHALSPFCKSNKLHCVEFHDLDHGPFYDASIINDIVEMADGWFHLPKVQKGKSESTKKYFIHKN